MSNDILAKVFTSEHLNKTLFAKEPDWECKIHRQTNLFSQFPALYDLKPARAAFKTLLKLHYDLKQ